MNKLLQRFFRWRMTHVSDKQYIYFLSVFVGIMAAISAIIIKKSTHLITHLLNLAITSQGGNFLYFLYPAVGILIAVLFMRYIVRSEPGHGIPGVLHSISRKNGLIKRHNTYSAIVASAFTVGFGGSVGLEGPTVSTGAAIGSNIGQLLRLNYKQITLMISVASSAAMAAIFQAPIAGMVFALEVIMIDLTMASVIPLLLASASAVLTSYFVLGQTVAYPITQVEKFVPWNTPYYIVLGILVGLVSVYFTQVYIASERLFRRFKSWQISFLVGSLVLGVLIFFFPALYGEGYRAINESLQGDYSVLYDHSIFYRFKDIKWVVFLLFVAVIMLKAVASSVTFGAGGVGGIFAPALFIGAFTGLFFAIFAADLGFSVLNPTKFAMVGMGGVIAGILMAPLTGIFLIAEITGGYSLFMPLMIVCTISYATVRIFLNNSVYTYQLARSGDLLTHNKDKNVLSQMSVSRLIETNFHKIQPGTSLGDLVKIIAVSKRNIFPVVDSDANFLGHILLDDIRNIMFDNDLYHTSIENIMVMPTFTISPTDTMETVAHKFQESGKYNIVVVQYGRYIGYISRANVFSTYRKKLSEVSED